ncbi:hypothetical protein DSO57_1019680 [Entomophthora muscae]|uniref:Uncharacterized protein n=1 Tax=Entomophthora muscae TaxID=34485 RepID=A0ACC2S5U4_9FUNG|nr:hypothetical protein DSO57_1019680 [Entomophthora muscae]
MGPIRPSVASCGVGSGPPSPGPGQHILLCPINPLAGPFVSPPFAGLGPACLSFVLGFSLFFVGLFGLCLSGGVFFFPFAPLFLPFLLQRGFVFFFFFCFVFFLFFFSFFFSLSSVLSPAPPPQTLPSYFGSFLGPLLSPFPFSSPLLVSWVPLLPFFCFSLPPFSPLVPFRRSLSSSRLRAAPSASWLPGVFFFWGLGGSGWFGGPCHLLPLRGGVPGPPSWLGALCPLRSVALPSLPLSPWLSHWVGAVA